jgi:ADP-ribose pyrophosphatase
VQWQGDAWRLRVFEITLPDGSRREKGAIEHPGSVVIVPFQAGQVFMIRQYRLALRKTILELPAGTRHQGEDWLACARRELREETGYRAEEWTTLGQLWPAPGITDELMAVYLATDLRPDPLPADADEEIELAPFPLDDLRQMALDGRLHDAKSVVGIIRAHAYLHGP